MTNLLNRLNNLFPTDEIISQVKDFLENGNVPEGSSPKTFARKYKHFGLNTDHRLVYRPLELIVLKKS